MRRSSRILFGSLLLLALAPLAARADDAPVVAATTPEWATRAFLDTHLTKACDAVEASTGATYPERPRLALTDQAGMTAVLIKEMGPVFRNLGVKSDRMIEATSKQLSMALTAKYEPSTNTIHVMPENIIRLAEMMEMPQVAQNDPIRILLVHEATHALDFQRFEALERERQSRTTTEGIQAVGAVIEGHAQLVAERVSMVWELHKAFETFSALIVSEAPTDDPAQRVMNQAMLAETRFSYGLGLVFMRAVEAARGREGVEAVLRAPPATTRPIERPEEWLDPSLGRGPIDPEPVFEIARPLMGESTTQPLKRIQLQGVYSMVPAAERDPVLSAFDNATMLIGPNVESQTLVSFIVVAFDDEAAAQAYIGLSERLLKLKDELLKTGSVIIDSATYDHGLGPDKAVPGVYCAKKISVPAQGVTQDVIVVSASEGRIALELTLIDPTQEREAIEHVMLAALAVLRGDAPDERDDAEHDAASLEELATQFRLAQIEDDEPALRKLGAALAPTEAELRAILREGPATDAFVEAYAGPVGIAPTNDQALEVGREVLAPGAGSHTRVRAIAATTEAIAAYERDSVAWREFPGGMRRFAQSVAAPGRTWYVVEWTEPGEDAGMKYTCFTRVGGRFVFVFEPWRFLPSR